MREFLRDTDATDYVCKGCERARVDAPFYSEAEGGPYCETCVSETECPGCGEDTAMVHGMPKCPKACGWIPEAVKAGRS